MNGRLFICIMTIVHDWRSFTIAFKPVSSLELAIAIPMKTIIKFGINHYRCCKPPNAVAWPSPNAFELVDRGVAFRTGNELLPQPSY